MKIMVKTFGSALVALLLGGTAPASAADGPETLRIGLLPTEDNVEMVKQFQGIADYVGQQVGLPTKIWISQSFNALIEAMGADQIDIGYVGGGQYIAARNEGIDVVPIVVTKTPAYEGDKVGRTYYKSVIIARTESDIRNLQDLKSKTFAFVAPTSTSGGIAPRFRLLQNGLIPEKDFEKFVYATTHEAVFVAVKNGKVDAGAMADHYFHRYKNRGMLDFSEYDEPNDVLKDSELHIVSAQKVPGTPMIVRGKLGEEFIGKLRAAFLSVPFGAVDQMRFWGQTLGFVETSHKNYEDVAAMKQLAAEIAKAQKKSN
jgi:phosphonate transport system substrate-binding protein